MSNEEGRRQRIRRLQEPPQSAEARSGLEELARKADYAGNPYHKRNPGDFRCIPPSAPRLDKTLCDGVGVYQKAVAINLLRLGIRRGFVSRDRRGSWPQNVWAVIGGQPLEASLTNREQGTYHGYPMNSSDPLVKEVLDRWGVP